jgi:hypothetical protein
MKKFIISEEEKNRILGMHQDATKRHYLKEQEDESSIKPSYVDNQGNKYFVPNLSDSNFSDFIYLSEKDDFMGKLNMLSSLGVKVGISNNPLSVPKETFQQEFNKYKTNLEKTQGDVASALEGLTYLNSINTIENTLASALQIYLKMWRPNMKGMNLINNVAFQNNPTIKNVKRVIPNIEEVLPKVLNMKSERFGVNLV